MSPSIPLIMPWNGYIREWSHDSSVAAYKTKGLSYEEEDAFLVAKYGRLALYENYMAFLEKGDDPSRPGASDEERLAAGWWQETYPIDNDRTVDSMTSNWNQSKPAPGVAGKWRVCGNFWVRWVTE